MEGLLDPAYRRNFDVAPDGQQFLGVLPGARSDPDVPTSYQINIVLNWFQELRERVPVD